MKKKKASREKQSLKGKTSPRDKKGRFLPVDKKKPAAKKSQKKPVKNNKKTAKKDKGGRPSSFKKKVNLEQVEVLAGLGLTEKEIALVLGVAYSTLRRWKSDARLCAAIKKGKIKADSAVIKSLYSRATGGDTTACIFWLKNRLPKDWKDRKAIVMGGDDELPPVPIVFVERASKNPGGKETKDPKKSEAQSPPGAGA